MSRNVIVVSFLAVAWCSTVAVGQGVTVDHFNDDSITDGSPSNWLVQDGSVSITPGGLEVTVPAGGTGAILRTDDNNGGGWSVSPDYS